MTSVIGRYARSTLKTRSPLLTFPLFFVSLLNFSSEARAQAWQLHFSISILPPVSPSFPPHHPLFKFTRSCLFSGKRLEMSAVMYVQQIIIFITVCTETRGAEKRMKTRAAKASAYQWWRGGTDSVTHTYTHTHTHTHNISLICTHTLPLHRPVAHVQCFLVLFSAVRQCDRSPCGRGATCQEAPGGYRCLCPPGWTGRTCQLGQWVTIKHVLYTVYTCRWSVTLNNPVQ